MSDLDKARLALEKLESALASMKAITDPTTKDLAVIAGLEKAKQQTEALIGLIIARDPSP